MIWDGEEWAPVRGAAEGWPYEVSRDGRVRRADTLEPVLPYDNGAGYLRVDLRRRGDRIQAYVHRLVLEAFVRPIRADEQAHHRDHDSGHNALGNLTIVPAAAHNGHGPADPRFADLPF